MISNSVIIISYERNLLSLYLVTYREAKRLLLNAYCSVSNSMQRVDVTDISQLLQMHVHQR